MADRSRRWVLKTSIAATVAGLAGCGDQVESGSTDSSGENKSTTAQTDRAELQARIDEMEARLAELRTEVTEKEEKITTIENNTVEKEKLTTLESETEEIRAELEQKTTRVEELEASLDEKEQRIAELEAESTGEAGFSESVLETVRAEAKEVRKATTHMFGDNGSGGTGWFHEDGYLITNSHVVEGNNSFTARTFGGENFQPELLGRSVVSVDPYHDVAVFDIDISPPNTLPIGESESLEKDQPLFQVGHPIGFDPWTVSIGRYVKGTEESVLTTVPSASGSSGSALMTKTGKVVGITTGSAPRNSDSVDTTQSGLEIRKEFNKKMYTTHDTTDLITKYVEKFG